MAPESLSTSWDLCLHHLARYDNMSSIAQKSSQLLRESAKRLLQVGIPPALVGAVLAPPRESLLTIPRTRIVNPSWTRDTTSLYRRWNLAVQRAASLLRRKRLNTRPLTRSWTISLEAATPSRRLATLRASKCGTMLLLDVRRGHSCRPFLSWRRFHSNSKGRIFYDQSKKDEATSCGDLNTACNHPSMWRTP